MFKKTLVLLTAVALFTSCLKEISKYEQQEHTDTVNAQGIELYLRTHKVVDSEYGPMIETANDGDPDNLWETRRTAPVTKNTPYEDLIGHVFMDSTKVKVVEPSGDTIERATGMWIYVHNEGYYNQFPIDSSAVLVKYTGYLLNDEPFDIQPTGATFYLNSSTITGFSAGMKYFQPGHLEEVTYEGSDKTYMSYEHGGTGLLIIPSKFAYGDEVSGSIPPNSVLVFNINLLSIADFIPDGEEFEKGMVLKHNCSLTKWMTMLPVSSYIAPKK